MTSALCKATTGGIKSMFKLNFLTLTTNEKIKYDILELRQYCKESMSRSDPYTLVNDENHRILQWQGRTQFVALRSSTNLSL